MLKPFTCVLMLVFLSGCVSRPPQPAPREYREIPEGYLQECELPSAPLVNGSLSEALVIAYKCAEQGNRDKQRIRAIVKPTA